MAVGIFVVNPRSNKDKLQARLRAIDKSGFSQIVLSKGLSKPATLGAAIDVLKQLFGCTDSGSVSTILFKQPKRGSKDYKDKQSAARRLRQLLHVLKLYQDGKPEDMPEGLDSLIADMQRFVSFKSNQMRQLWCDDIAFAVKRLPAIIDAYLKTCAVDAAHRQVIDQLRMVCEELSSNSKNMQNADNRAAFIVSFRRAKQLLSQLNELDGLCLLEITASKQTFADGNQVTITGALNDAEAFFLHCYPEEFNDDFNPPAARRVTATVSTAADKPTVKLPVAASKDQLNPGGLKSQRSIKHKKERIIKLKVACKPHWFVRGVRKLWRSICGLISGSKKVAMEKSGTSSEVTQQTTPTAPEKPSSQGAIYDYITSGIRLTGIGIADSCCAAEESTAPSAPDAPKSDGLTP